MDTKYIIGIVIVILAVIAIGAYALGSHDSQTAPVVNNTTDKVVNHTVNKTVNHTVNKTVNDTANKTKTEKEVKKETESSSSTVYYASKKTDKFHKPNCEWAQKINSKNLITFNSRDAAISSGRSPCEVCNP